MNNDVIVYENKLFRIVNRDTFYVLQDKEDKSDDQYFTTLPQAKKYIGVIDEDVKNSYFINNKK